MARGKNRKYTFQQYLDEARRTPFTLAELPDGAPDVVIPVPDGDTMLAIADNQANPRLVLELLCGSAGRDQVLELFGPAPMSAMQDFLTDVMAHFGMGVSRQGDSSAP